MTNSKGRMNGAATKPRLLGAALLVALVALAPMATGTASAGTVNSGQDGCLYAHNYADPASGYLFAASEAAAPDCLWMRVEILNNGWLHNPGSFVGWCSGVVHASDEGTSYYAATSVVIDAAQWSTPCSNHRGAPEPNMLHRLGKLPFLYR